MRLRNLLVFLVLANVVAFGWWHGELDQLLGSQREPERLRQQIDADRLVVLPGQNGRPDPAGAAAAGAGTPGARSSGNGAAARASGVCVEIGPLEEARAQRLRQFLADNSPVLRSNAEQLDDSGSWMVFLPPADSLASAQKRVADLRKLGVPDLYLIPDGSFRYAISFGLFRSEESARAWVESLLRQGVKGLKVALRSANEPKTLFSIRYPQGDDGPSPELLQRLAALQGELGVSGKPCEVVAR